MHATLVSCDWGTSTRRLRLVEQSAVRGHLAAYRRVLQNGLPRRRIVTEQDHSVFCLTCPLPCQR